MSSDESSDEGTSLRGAEQAHTAGHVKYEQQQLQQHEGAGGGVFHETREPTLELLQERFDKPLIEVAKEFRVSLTMIKRLCRKVGIQRWPHRQIRSLDKLLKELEQRLMATNSPREVAYLQEQVALLEKKKRLVTRGASSGMQSALRNALFMANPEHLLEENELFDNEKLTQLDSAIAGLDPTEQRRISHKGDTNPVLKIMSNPEKPLSKRKRSAVRAAPVKSERASKPRARRASSADHEERASSGSAEEDDSVDGASTDAARQHCNGSSGAAAEWEFHLRQQQQQQLMFQQQQHMRAPVHPLHPQHHQHEAFMHPHHHHQQQQFYTGGRGIWPAWSGPEGLAAVDGSEQHMLPLPHSGYLFNGGYGAVAADPSLLQLQQQHRAQFMGLNAGSPLCAPSAGSFMHGALTADSYDGCSSQQQFMNAAAGIHTESSRIADGMQQQLQQRSDSNDASEELDAADGYADELLAQSHLLQQKQQQHVKLMHSHHMQQMQQAHPHSQHYMHQQQQQQHSGQLLGGLMLPQQLGNMDLNAWALAVADGSIPVSGTYDPAAVHASSYPLQRSEAGGGSTTSSSSSTCSGDADSNGSSDAASAAGTTTTAGSANGTANHHVTGDSGGMSALHWSTSAQLHPFNPSLRGPTALNLAEWNEEVAASTAALQALNGGGNSSMYLLDPVGLHSAQFNPYTQRQGHSPPTVQ